MSFAPKYATDSQPSVPDESFLVSSDGKTWILGGPIDNRSGTAILAAHASLPPGEAATLYIDSPGGDALLTMAVAHILLRDRPSLTTHTLGDCASAGVHLLQAGALRVAVPMTCFYTHQIQASIDITPTGNEGFTKQFNQDADCYADFLRRRAGKTLKFWKKFLEVDRYFNAAEALKLGLIDAIR